MTCSCSFFWLPDTKDNQWEWARTTPGESGPRGSLRGDMKGNSACPVVPRRAVVIKG